MSPPPIPGDNERQKYANLLSEIKRKTDVATQLVRQPRIAEVEYAALLVRMILEMIVVSSLVTMKGELESVSKVLHKRDYKSARKLARQANVNYWPRPSHGL